MRSHHIILVPIMAISALFLLTMYAFSASQYKTEDTNWPIRYLQNCANTLFFHTTHTLQNHQISSDDELRQKQKQKPHPFWTREFDPAFSGVMNSVFPVDSIISYNTTNPTNSSQMTSEFVARYAAFSPILKGEVRGQYIFVAGNACTEIDPDTNTNYTDKILVVSRGKCSFVQKLDNIIAAKLRPRAVVVANNVPHSGLITMYSKALNGHDALGFPVLFMTFEDAETISHLYTQNPHMQLAIRTASFDGVFGLVLSMAVSPPLMILLCYLIIRGMQVYTRRRRNQRNQRYVRSLPVHIYNRSHLVPCVQYYDYLVATGQTGEIPPVSVSSSTDDVSTTHNREPTPPSSSMSASVSPEHGPWMVGGTDLFSLPIPLLFAHTDFYPTQKCSICLGRFVALKSRVLVLGCKHVFHEKCLSNWLINFRKTCPLCNEALQMPAEAGPVSENSPLSEGSLSDYGASGAHGSDLESGLSGHVTERLSTTAVRSLRVEPEPEPEPQPQSRRENPTPHAGPPSPKQNVQDVQNSSSLQNLQDSHFKRPYIPETAPPPKASVYGPLIEPSVSPSDASFVTTKSHQSAAISHTHSLASYASSYYTSAGVLNDGDIGGETSSYESSRSTLRFTE